MFARPQSQLSNCCLGRDYWHNLAKMHGVCATSPSKKKLAKGCCWLTTNGKFSHHNISSSWKNNSPVNSAVWPWKVQSYLSYYYLMMMQIGRKIDVRSFHVEFHKKNQLQSRNKLLLGWWTFFQWLMDLHSFQPQKGQFLIEKQPNGFL